jgi:hypothetical protein
VLEAQHELAQREPARRIGHEDPAAGAALRPHEPARLQQPQRLVDGRGGDTALLSLARAVDVGAGIAATAVFDALPSVTATFR